MFTPTSQHPILCTHFWGKKSLKSHASFGTFPKINEFILFLNLSLIMEVKDYISRINRLHKNTNALNIFS